VSAKLHTVHVRVNDAATGQPTPCRVRFTAQDGTYYAPLGRLTDFATAPEIDVGGNLRLDERCYAYIDGTCEIRLPAGYFLVEVSKGPEYVPLNEHVHLATGKLALRFTLKRWINLRESGWYSGVCTYEPAPHAALLEGAAEDIAVVNLLAREMKIDGEQGRSYLGVRHLLAFSGQRPTLERPGHVVVVNTSNFHRELGNLFLLNCHRIVYPLSFGGADGLENWTVADWCDQCHRKGGLVIGNGHKYYKRESLADHILSKVDALALCSFEHPENQHPVLAEWYDLLACGFRVPVVSGVSKRSNSDNLGEVRTYAQLLPGQEFNYRNWIESVRAGRTFVTSGPLLNLAVNEQGPGSVVDLGDATPKVHVRAEARSPVVFDRLEVAANGSMIASADADFSRYAIVETDVPIAVGGWLAARCIGPYDHHRADHVGAQTSPIYVTVRGEAPRPNAASVRRLVDHLDHVLEWVRSKGRFENDQQRDRLAGIFRAAKEELARRAAG
jgi:hypothetical protein